MYLHEGLKYFGVHGRFHQVSVESFTSSSEPPPCHGWARAPHWPSVADEGWAVAGEASRASTSCSNTMYFHECLKFFGVHGRFHQVSAKISRIQVRPSLVTDGRVRPTGLSLATKAGQWQGRPHVQILSN
eukprot:4884416-Pyramimonas_sp.AAC.1